jgi:hypothetical protein
MSTSIPAVQNTKSIIDAEFVKLEVAFTNGTDRIYRSLNFSNSYKSETISGVTYSELGILMGVGSYQRDITSNGYDTGVTITGLDQKYIYFVTGGPATTPIPVTGQDPIPIGYYPQFKGSKVEIRRGFYNTNYVLTSNVLRYTGIVTSYTITENRDTGYDAIDDTYAITFLCSPFRQVLENRIAGRKTNSKSWKFFSPTDTSMDRVTGLEGTAFNFGKDV